VVAHLGRVEDILRLTQDERSDIKISSVTSGAVTALHHLAQELDIAGKIDRALEKAGRRVQKRDGLSVGESLLAGMISRACAPRSKRAFAAWAEATALPELMGFAAQDLDSQHFWDQMHTLPVALLGAVEQAIVREVIGIEQLQPRALAYDTTNFYTHIASTNQRPELAQRGHNKQGRHDPRQLGLALVVDQDTQLPLAHVLYEGARSDMRTFAAFLKPVRERLHTLTSQPQQLTLVMWSAPLCRVFELVVDSAPECGGQGVPLARHNQSASRKARSLSSGWNRRKPGPAGATFSSAFSLVFRSASIYACVVSMLSWPSQSAITAMSTPD
jgi:hypothetical protein